VRGARSRTVVVGLASLLVALIPSLGASRPLASMTDDGHSPPSAQRPNIVVVVVDDLRWDEFGAAGHPYLQTPNIDRLAREGAMFTNSFHAVPLCSPNRASILTGQYPSRHGIIDNVARNLASHGLQTFPITLQEEGYDTGFFGKWHMGNDPTPRPGFNTWAAIPGQGRTTDPELFEDGRVHVVEGYVTDVLTDRAVKFIERDRDQPFFLYLSHKAVHPTIQQLDDGSTDESTSFGFMPAPRHRGVYEDRVLPPRGNEIATLADLVGKPTIQRALMANLGVAADRDLASVRAPGADQETIRRRAEMLLAVDEGLGRIIEALDSQGILDETMVMFTSENGYFYGEHGLTSERRMPYEEAIRNPLVIRYPPEAAAGSRPSGLTVSVDIAPTILQIAGAPIGDHIAGNSLVPLLRGNDHTWRQSVLVEFFTYENPFQHLVDMDYRAVRTSRYKYIHWIKFPDQDELYDLQKDPCELHNVVEDPGMQGLRAELRTELGRLQLQAMGLGPR